MSSPHWTRIDWAKSAERMREIAQTLHANRAVSDQDAVGDREAARIAKLCEAMARRERLGV